MEHSEFSLTTDLTAFDFFILIVYTSFQIWCPCYDYILLCYSVIYGNCYLHMVLLQFVALV